ncbi:TPA: helix-turn-helix transcriptional regulator [Streptococcus pneumoniae]|nr:helix-turn-helix transcriptional regulator [Streptococcus pneumoniae]
MTIGTHENIINAFFRIAAKKDARLITMAEIASEAHISRQAIYQKHFRTIDEIIDEIHQIIYQNTYSILSNFDPSHSTLNEYIACELLHKSYPHLNKISNQLKLSRDFLALFIVKYYVAIISSWLLQDLPMPLELFGKYFLQLVDIPIADYFDF